jgi:hypothetical protein
MRRGPVLAALLLLAGCGSAGETANGAADANQIERLAKPRVEKSDPRATARLQRLTREDLEREGLLGAGCSFSRDGQLLLAVVGSDALVRIAGQRRHLIHSAPAGATGGFFEDRQIAISVGRTDEGDGPPDTGSGPGQGTGSAPAPAGGTGWPARLKVVNRRTEAEVELRGVWTCAG